jgi:translocation protein SEC63
LWTHANRKGQTATEKQIKSVYRKLSVTDHPDKRRPDPAKNITIESINDHWVEITKAFKALTDEEIRRNYLEYGNPDGKQSTSIGLALPAFLVQEGNGKYVLLFYIALLGVAIPYTVGKWWYGSQKKTKEGIYVNSAGALFQAFREETDTSAIIEACAAAEEYKELLAGEKSESGLARIEQKILAPGEFSPYAADLTEKDKKKLERTEDAQRRKALALIWAYLGRVDLGDATLNDEKFEVGPIAQKLNDAFTVIALHFSLTEPVLSSYRLSQSLIQAIPPGGSPLLQLPYFTPKIVAAVEGPRAPKHTSIQKFMALPASARKAKVVGAGLLTDRQFQQSMAVAASLPLLQVERTFFKVHGERYVTPGSLVQFVVKARFIPPGSTNVPPPSPADLEEPDRDETKRTKTEDSNPPPLAHAPLLARDHAPKWHVFLSDAKQGKIAVPPFTFSTFDKPLFDAKGDPTYAVQTLKMQFGAPPQEGNYTFTMQLLCDSYVGLDTKVNVTMEVRDASMVEDVGDGGDISEPDEGESCFYTYGMDRVANDI